MAGPGDSPADGPHAAAESSHTVPPGGLPPVRSIAAVALGGAAGAAMRVGATAVLPAATGGVPVTTFVVNVTGAFLLAALLTLLVRRSSAILARPLLATGLLGSYTTVSSVAVEASLLARSGRLAVAGAYLAGTVAAGLVAALAGAGAVRRWSAAGDRGIGRQG